MKKPAKKSDQTKQKIAKEFWFLLRTQPLSEITVDELVNNAGVNRNTFYYHFKNMGDLIEYVVKGIVDRLLTRYPPKIDSIESCLIAGINFARNNKDAINNIYHSTSRAIFERHLWHVCSYSVNAYLKTMEPKIPPEEVELWRDFLKYECFGFAIDYINRDMPEDVTEKVKIMANSPVFRQMSKNIH